MANLARSEEVGAQEILDSASQPGALVALVGPRGSGKTHLATALAGIFLVSTRIRPRYTTAHRLVELSKADREGFEALRDWRGWVVVDEAHERHATAYAEGLRALGRVTLALMDKRQQSAAYWQGSQRDLRRRATEQRDSEWWRLCHL